MVPIEMAIMKNKKRKHGKSEENSLGDFIRDDVPIAPAKGDTGQRSTKKTKKKEGNEFHEFYY
jgi:hypothetical protein